MNDSTNELPISLPRTIVPDVESCLRLVTGYRGDIPNLVVEEVILLCTDVPVKLQEIHNIITNNRI